MNRFVSLVSKNKQNFLMAKLLTKNNSYSVTRSLASNSDKSDLTNPELNKPQWERSDRFKIFYGFSSNEAEDKGMAHYFTFVGLFGLIVLPTFVMYFFPDYKTNDWCHREAYLELSRREKAGEPLINPDYVPIDKIKLPSEEELGDTEIVI